MFIIFLATKMMSEASNDQCQCYIFFVDFSDFDEHLHGKMKHFDWHGRSVCFPASYLSDCEVINDYLSKIFYSIFSSCDVFTMLNGFVLSSTLFLYFFYHEYYGGLDAVSFFILHLEVTVFWGFPL